MTVVLHHINPPVPTRQFDWACVWEGHEPGDPVGRGPTHEDALADLICQAETDFSTANLNEGNEP